jgi:hypothetical protein
MSTAIKIFCDFYYDVTQSFESSYGFELAHSFILNHFIPNSFEKIIQRFKDDSASTKKKRDENHISVIANFGNNYLSNSDEPNIKYFHEILAFESKRTEESYAKNVVYFLAVVFSPLLLLGYLAIKFLSSIFNKISNWSSDEKLGAVDYR